MITGSSKTRRKSQQQLEGDDAPSGGVQIVRARSKSLYVHKRLNEAQGNTSVRRKSILDGEIIVESFFQVEERGEVQQEETAVKSDPPNEETAAYHKE